MKSQRSMTSSETWMVLGSSRKDLADHSMVLREPCPSNDVPMSGGILLNPTTQGHMPILSLTIWV